VGYPLDIEIPAFARMTVGKFARMTVGKFARMIVGKVAEDDSYNSHSRGQTVLKVGDFFQSRGYLHKNT